MNINAVATIANLDLIENIIKFPLSIRSFDNFCPLHVKNGASYGLIEREPNLIISSASQRIVEDGVFFKAEVYKLKGGEGWSLEVVTEDGPSIVWDDLFDDDNTAFDQAVKEIRKERPLAFANGGSNVIPLKRWPFDLRQALSRMQFYRMFKKYVQLAGLPPSITPHSARATFITEAYESGVQGEDIQRTVGHSSITTTEGYNHTAKRHRKSASFGVNY